jgi:hypothetical protein
MANLNNLTDMNDFRAITKLLQHANYFDFLMPLPSFLTFVHGAQNIRVFAQEISVPSLKSNVTVETYGNIYRSSSYFATPDTFTITFYDTTKLEVHKLFMKWLTSRHDAAGRVAHYNGTFGVDLTVQATGNKVYDIMCCFPTEVDEFKLSSQSQNQLGSFRVIFWCEQIKAVT